jgi:preprotein translocase subunit SecD
LLTEDGALMLARLTKSHNGDFLAIMLDGPVTAVPKIAAEITGGRAMIFGNFTEEEAEAVAKGIMTK